MVAKIFRPLLALIASATTNELAKYIEFLKEENQSQPIRESQKREQQDPLGAINLRTYRSISCFEHVENVLHDFGRTRQQGVSSR